MFPYLPRNLRAALSLLILSLAFTSSATNVHGLESGAKISAAIQKKWTGDYDGMVRRRAIRVLIPYSKTDFFIDGKTIRGYAVDLLREFEKSVNKKKKSSARVEIFVVPTKRDLLIPHLLAGIGDVAVANLTVTVERKEQVDFSTPFLRDVRELLVTSKATRERSGLNDLANIAIHVRRSSSYFSSLQAANIKIEAAGGSPINYVLVSEYLEDEDLLEMVNAGLIPAVIVDSHKASFWTKIFNNIKVHDAVAFRDNGEIAWAFRKNSPKLKAQVDAFAEKAKAGTSLGNTLLFGYYRKTKWLKRADSAKLAEKLKRLRSIFEMHGQRYNIDWLILAALAFKESRFDHSVRGPTGAIGIMQVKPSTARWKIINVPNIRKVEDNVHAATKYLRYIANSYFQDLKVDPFNQIMLTLAAYNAGPNRIAKLRKKARDPNVWFDSVERVVAREVNQIPVRYVINIAQYYAAFRLLVEAERQVQKEKDVFRLKR